MKKTCTYYLSTYFCLKFCWSYFMSYMCSKRAGDRNLLVWNKCKKNLPKTIPNVCVAFFSFLCGSFVRFFFFFFFDFTGFSFRFCSGFISTSSCVETFLSTFSVWNGRDYLTWDYVTTNIYYLSKGDFQVTNMLSYEHYRYEHYRYEHYRYDYIYLFQEPKNKHDVQKLAQ